MSERKGIPTMYEGVLMRSRTEARWAALFDDLGWEWVYEPIDLPGWIPDFVLKFPHAPLLVEIKSALEDFDGAMTKADKSGYAGEIAVLGHDIGFMTTGRIREEVPQGEEWFMGDGWNQIDFFQCLSCGRPSIKSYDFSWRCRVCGAHDGNAHVGDLDIESAWKKAGNRVQWKPEAA